MSCATGLNLRFTVAAILLIGIGLFVMGMSPIMRTLNDGISLSPLQTAEGKILLCLVFWGRPARHSLFGCFALSFGNSKLILDLR